MSSADMITVMSRVVPLTSFLPTSEASSLMWAALREQRSFTVLCSDRHRRNWPCTRELMPPASDAPRIVQRAAAPWWPDTPGHRRAWLHCAAAPARRLIPPAPTSGQSPASQRPVHAGSQAPRARQPTNTMPTTASTIVQASMAAYCPRPGTSATRLAAILPHRSPHPRSMNKPRSTPKSAAGGRALRPVAAPAIPTYLEKPVPKVADLPLNQPQFLCCENHLNPSNTRQRSIVRCW